MKLSGLAILLALGAAANIAVACACAWFGRLDRATRTIGWCTPDVALWRIDRAAGRGLVRYFFETDRPPVSAGDLSVGPGFRAAGAPRWADPGWHLDPAFRDWWTMAAGWPMPALSCGGRSDPDSRTTPPEIWNLIQVQTHALPLRPVPLGFTINTLFYAAAIGMVPLAAGVIRARLRLRRGLCPGCAYNLSGLPPKSACPECGRPCATSSPERTRSEPNEAGPPARG